MTTPVTTIGDRRRATVGAMLTPLIRARPRGIFLFGHHPWLLVVVIVIAIAVAVYQQRKR